MAESSGAATKTVCLSGCDYALIQSCANAAQAGDTCEVHAGSYDEYVLAANSGNQSKPIVFQAIGAVKMPGFAIIGKNFITVQGFEITDQGFIHHAGSNYSNGVIYLSSSGHIEITTNNIHNTFGTCIILKYSGPSSYSIIKNNSISYCGYAGMDVVGDHNLIDGNNISHADNFIQLNGSYNVIRNNILHDVSLADWATPGDSHIDGIETSPGVADLPHIRNLIENNYMFNGTDANTHFMLLRNSQNNTVSGQIIRYNTVNNIGSGFVVLGDPVHGVDKVVDTKIYGNTVVNDAVATPEYADLVVKNCPGTKIINNIFYNNVINNGSVFSVETNTSPGFYAGNNLDFLSSCGPSCTWQNTAFPYLNTVLNRDPLFINAINNFDLQSGSPAIDAGGALTKVSSADFGNGLSLTVEDAGFFQDGYSGIINSDWLAIGNISNIVRISAIDYSTNTITLSASVERTSGNSVWLFRDSAGRRVLDGAAPDIGAYEYAGSTPLPQPAPTSYNITNFTSLVSDWLKNISNSPADVNTDGSVNAKDLGIMMSKWK